MKKIGMMIGLVSVMNVSLAQLPAYTDIHRYYQEGWEFYHKGQYENAIRSFDYYLESQGAVNNTHIFSPSALSKSASSNQNDLRAFAEYYRTISLYYLGNKDSEIALRSFLKKYPEHTQIGYVNYCLGKLLFQHFHYKECVEPFVNAPKQATLTESEMYDINFGLAYSYFMQTDYTNADRYFTRLTQRANPYQTQSIYYHSLIAYNDNQYEEALKGFEQIGDVPTYHDQILLLKANTLLALKRYDDLYALADELEASGDMNNQDPQIFFIVANTSYERKEYDKAAHYFDLYEKAGNELNRPSNLRYGYSYFSQEKYDQAIPIFERVLKENDSLAQFASYYLGFSFVKEKKYEEARFAYFKAANTVSGNDDMRKEALFQSAKLAFVNHENTEALSTLIKIEKESPKAPYIGEVKDMIGELYLIAQNYADAISYFESAPLTSNRAKLAYQTVCYYYGLEKIGIRDYETANQYLEKAANYRMDTKTALSAIFWQAEAKYQQNDYANAATAYTNYMNEEGAIDHEYFDNALYGKAWAFFKLKKYNQALEVFENFLKISQRAAEPIQLADAHLRAGDCEFMLRQYAKAIKHYDAAMKVASMQSDYAIYQIAESNYRLGKYDESIKKFVQLINTSNFSDSDLRDNALDRVSEIYLTWKKDAGRSAVYAKMLVDEYPRNQLVPAAYNRLAQAAYEAEKPDQAIIYYKKILNDYTYDTQNCEIALDNLSSIMEPDEYDKVLKSYRSKNPKSSAQLDALTLKAAEDRYYNKNYNSAIDLLNDFLADNPEGKQYFEALYFRAESYKLLGKFDKAFDDYEKVYNATNEYTSKALDAAAKLKFAQKDYAGSKQLYLTLDNLSQRVENKVNAKFGAAKAMMAMDDYNGAIEVLQDIEKNEEVDIPVRAKAGVQIGNCYFALKKYDDALNAYKTVTTDNRDNSGAEAQYMMVSALYEQGKYKESVDAAKFMRNNFPDSDWKAKSFLVVAEDNVKLNNIFQAKAVLESIMKDDRYPEVVKLASGRLEELNLKEAADRPAVEENETPPVKEEQPKPEPIKPQTGTTKPKTEPSKPKTGGSTTGGTKPKTPTPTKGKGK